ncbi:MAG: hypothetical protein ACE5R6_00815 [Candidatus Heimdallarchaeota archaeon]
MNPNSRFQPLGLGIIAALTPHSWTVEIADENFTPFKFQKADLVGLTASQKTSLGRTRFLIFIEKEEYQLC